MKELKDIIVEDSLDKPLYECLGIGLPRYEDFKAAMDQSLLFYMDLIVQFPDEARITNLFSEIYKRWEPKDESELIFVSFIIGRTIERKSILDRILTDLMRESINNNKPLNALELMDDERIQYLLKAIGSINIDSNSDFNHSVGNIGDFPNLDLDDII